MNPENFSNKLYPNISLFANKILSLKKFKTLKDLDLLFVIPGDHTVKFIDLFKTLESKSISFLVVIHNLTLIQRLFLLRKNVSFVKATEISIKNSDPKRINNYKVAEYLFRISHPKLLITSTDPEKKTFPFIKTAKSNNVKTITIQHGAYLSPKGADFKSDIALIWGSYYKTWFIHKLNKNPNRLFITGSPFFDKYRIKPYQRVSKNINGITVLILLTFYRNLKKDLNKELVILVNHLAKIGIKEILIRPHPWQQLSDSIFLKKENISVRRVTNKSLAYYLKKTDVVITLDTTAGFDALTMGKPTIYWNFSKYQALPFKAGGVPAGRTPEEVISKLSGVVSGKLKVEDDKRRLLLKEVFYKLDSRSSLRTANVIEGFLKDRI